MPNSRRSFLTSLGLIAAGCGCAAVLVAPVRAGGWGIFADLPRATHPAELRECALVVHPDVYHVAGAKVSVTLEGILDGKRVTRDLEPIIVGSWRHTYLGIRRDWPEEGRWVVSVAATTDVFHRDHKNGRPVGEPKRLRTVAYVPIGPDGTPEMREAPGGKYDRQPVVVRSSFETRWTTLAGLLRPTDRAVAAR